jgi:hypothetical protein
MLVPRRRQLSSAPDPSADLAPAASAFLTETKLPSIAPGGSSRDPLGEAVDHAPSASQFAEQHRFGVQKIPLLSTGEAESVGHRTRLPQVDLELPRLATPMIGTPRGVFSGFIARANASSQEALKLLERPISEFDRRLSEAPSPAQLSRDRRGRRTMGGTSRAQITASVRRLTPAMWGVRPSPLLVVLPIPCPHAHLSLCLFPRPCACMVPCLPADTRSP